MAQTDLAELTLALDTRPLEQATAANENFARSVTEAEARTRMYESIAKRSNTTVEEVRKRYENAAQAVGRFARTQTEAVAGTTKQNAAIEQYKTRLGQLELRTRGMYREEAQFMALRRAGLTIYSEQGKKVAQMAGEIYDLEKASAKSNDSMSRLANTLTRRFLVGFAVSQLRGLVSWVWNLNTAMSKTLDIAQRSGLGTGAFQGLQGAAQNKGVDESSFGEAMIEFGREVDKAKRGVGDLYKLMQANGMAAKTTEQAFSNIADLVARARDEEQKVQILRQAGLPTSREFVKYMEQGSRAIREQANAVDKVSEAQLKAAAKIDADWTALMTKLEQGSKKTVVTLSEAISQIPAPGSPMADFMEMMRGNKSWSLNIDLTPPPGSNLAVLINFLKSNSLNRGVTGAAPPTAPHPGDNDLMPGGGIQTSAVTAGGALSPATARKPVVTQAEIDAANNALKERVSILGDLATREQLLSVKQMEVNKAIADRTGLTKTEAAAVMESYRVQIDGARLQVRESNGIVTVQELMIQKQKELNIQVQNGTLTQQQANQALANYSRHAEAAADAAAVYGASLPGLMQLERQSMSLRNNLDELGTSIASGISSPLKEMYNGSITAAEGFNKMKDVVISAIQDIIIKMLIVAPIARALQATMGAFLPGGGGVTPIASSTVAVMHGGGRPGRDMSGTRNIPTDMISYFPRFHNGKVPWGPDEQPAILHKSEAVVPQGMAMSGSGNVAVYINNVPEGMGANAKQSRDENGVRIDIELERKIESVAVASMQKGRLKDATADTFSLNKARNLT